MSTNWLGLDIAVGDSSVFLSRLIGFIPGRLSSLISGLNPLVHRGVRLRGVSLGGDAKWVKKYIAPGASDFLFHVILGLAMMLFFR